VDALFANLDLIVGGFAQTLKLLAVSGLIALLVGTVVAAARVSPVAVLRGTAATYVGLFRNTPLLVLIIITHYGFPELDLKPGFFVLVTLAMGTYTASFVAEALRSGVNSVSPGQAEAARAVGLTFSQSMRQVIFPQAFRATVPPMASVFIALTKNTSLAAAFGIAEATFRAEGLSNNNADAKYEILIGVALGYILIVEVISLAAWSLERRWKVESR
jgi:glutamate transport system permease protein